MKHETFPSQFTRFEAVAIANASKTPNQTRKEAIAALLAVTAKIEREKLELQQAQDEAVAQAEPKKTPVSLLSKIKSFFVGSVIEKNKPFQPTKAPIRRLSEAEARKILAGYRLEQFARRIEAEKHPAHDFVLPSFVNMAAIKKEKRHKNESLRSAFAEKSAKALPGILADYKVYNALLQHIHKAGKVTNSVIEDFLITSSKSVEGVEGLTKGITNLNLRDAVKAFGQKLEEDKYVSLVEQGTTKVRKLHPKFKEATEKNNAIVFFPGGISKSVLSSPLPEHHIFPQADRRLVA